MRAEEGRWRAVAASVVKLSLLLGLLLAAPLAGNAAFAKPQGSAAGTADLGMLVSGGNPTGHQFRVGESFRNGVAVINGGPDAVDDLSTRITFSRAPSSVRFETPVDPEPAHTACTWSGTTVTCHATSSAPPAPEGVASQVQLHIVMSTPGTLTITATASSSQLDPNPTDNTGSGSTIVLPRRACRVPNLLGKTLARARRALANADCRLGHVGHTVSSARRRGRVVAQHPRAGVRTKAQARVRVVLGSGPRP